MQSILILGAGPAGAATALGLRRLGYPVTLISDWRRFPALEGVSQRVLQALHSAGLAAALTQALRPSQRRVAWNGDEHAQNIEYLVDRPAFDQGLRLALRDAGVRLIEGRVLALHSDACGHRVQVAGHQPLHGEFLVEARGRQAPLLDKALREEAGNGRRGPQTLSLLNRWQGVPGEAASAVYSLEDGWAWMARCADGQCYWQLTLDVPSTRLPGKAHLLEYCRQRRQGSALARDLFGAAPEQQLQLHARSSTAILSPQVCGTNWLRVGDAAMAVDPLSGNGIFQSLSSALQAPAVINTLLQRPERCALARQFHRQRVQQLFLRFARIGRDFYADEQRWAEQPFWQARRHWPDAQPAHQRVEFSALRIERAPVLRDSLVDEADVVITPDQPLGIWHVQGVELAPLLRRLQQQGPEQALTGLNPEQDRAVRGWLLGQGYRP